MAEGFESPTSAGRRKGRLTPFLALLPLAVAFVPLALEAQEPLPSPAPPASTPAATALPAPPPPALMPAPAPVVPVDWLFVFKLNAAKFATPATGADRLCPFGGDAQPYATGFSQAYAAASSAAPALQAGMGLAGTSGRDPLGASFSQLWNGTYNYVVWNDQFYRHPPIQGCSDSCGAPWGHSKGMLAWNDAGEGMLIQVTTPSWPAAASRSAPRSGDGNTLGCIGDNDVKVSQDFFSLRLSEPDVEAVLDALANASVVTDVSNPALVHSGGPAAIQAKVALLGRRSPSVAVLDTMLSSGVRLIAKPSALHVPPWQLVSSRLGGAPLRTATWWTNPAIPSTSAATAIACWNASLAKPGPVEIATTGHWAGLEIGLRGGPMPDANHAKIGVSTAGDHAWTIFGDMNQQGALSGNCGSSQNGRGGLFFVVENQALHDSVAALIQGQSAPLAP